MSTDFEGNGNDGETAPFASGAAVADDAPTETLVASSVGDRCVNCGATLTSDQRYCVVCGERRGAPRFTLPVAGPAVQSATTTTTTSRPTRSGGPRFGPGATLVAGVGTLLLALLVGFVIGNAASKSNTKTVTTGSGVKVINVGGSSAGATTASTGTSTAASSAPKTKHSSHSHSHKAKKATSAATKKTTNAETGAAQKVLGGNNTPPANTKVGQKCTGSSCKKPGYNKKTHRFDGSFFGQ